MTLAKVIATASTPGGLSEASVSCSFVCYLSEKSSVIVCAHQLTPRNRIGMNAEEPLLKEGD